MVCDCEWQRNICIGTIATLDYSWAKRNWQKYNDGVNNTSAVYVPVLTRSSFVTKKT
jgi:hypothetical protein